MVTGPYQPSLLDLLTGPALPDGPPPVPGPQLLPLAGALRRHELSDGAWVDHLPGWVLGSDDVLRTLLEDVDWQARRRRMYDAEIEVPRLLRWYGEGEALPHQLLLTAREALDDHYGAVGGDPFVTAGMCLYRDGRDGVAWHGDTIGRGRHEDTLVAIVSFGSPRALLLRPRDRPPHARGDCARPVRFSLGHGDLVVMGGTCQRTWEHSVPRTSRSVGPRVSVQFRPRDVT